MKQLLFSLKEGSVSYHKKEILKELDINIHRKDFIALVGKNGAGKSTLMNVISGQHDIDAGEKWSIDNFAVNYFNQNFVLNDDNNTVEQEILSVIKNQDNNYEIDIFCNNLSIDKNSLIKHLSGGQKRRVGLIKNLIKPSDLLLLDEPTNHLDLDTIVWLENYLKKLDCAILCVSHDRQFLKNFTNKILWIDRSKIKINYKGYSDFDNWSETLLSQEERELQNRKQFVNLEVNWANKGVKARVKRNTRRLEKAKDLKENLDKDISEFKKATKKIEINQIYENSKNFKNVAEFHNAEFYYGENKKNFILKNFNLKISKKDRIGLLGGNGSGKTTFLKILLNELNLKSGTIKLRKELEFSYFDQLRNDLKDNLPIKRVLVPSGGDYLKTQGKDRHVCSYLKDFHFDPSKANDPVGSLSGGMKNRLLLSKVLSNPKNGLILDEPTNDLDIDTLDLVESILSNYNGTLVVVSHNRDFLDKLVNKILFFKGNGNVLLFNGGYHDFLKNKDLLENDINNLTQNENKFEKKNINLKNLHKKKLTFKLQYELNNLPEQIDLLKEEILHFEKIIEAPDLYKKDYELFISTTKKLGSLQIELENKEQRWLELMELN